MRRLISGAELIEKKGWSTRTLLERIQNGLQPYHPVSKEPIDGASDMPSNLQTLEVEAFRWVRQNWTCYTNDIQTDPHKTLKELWADWVTYKQGFLDCLLEHDFDDGQLPEELTKPIIEFWLPSIKGKPIDYNTSTEDHIRSWMYDEADLLPAHLQKIANSSELYSYLQQVTNLSVLVRNLKLKLKDDSLKKKNKCQLRALLFKLQGSAPAKQIYQDVLTAEGEEGTTKDPERQARRWIVGGVRLASKMRLHTP